MKKSYLVALMFSALFLNSNLSQASHDDLGDKKPAQPVLVITLKNPEPQEVKRETVVLPMGAKFQDGGKTLYFDNEVEFATPSNPHLTDTVKAAIKADVVEKIIVNGKLGYMQKTFDDLAEILPTLKKLKVLNLDLFYFRESDETNAQFLRDKFKDCHGLTIEMAFSFKVVKTIEIQ